MNTCDTCKFWGENSFDSSKENGIEIRHCQSLHVIQPNYGERGNKSMFPVGILTCDEGGGTGELATGPKFGCVHHEPK